MCVLWWSVNEEIKISVRCGVVECMIRWNIRKNVFMKNNIVGKKYSSGFKIKKNKTICTMFEKKKKERKMHLSTLGSSLDLFWVSVEPKHKELKTLRSSNVGGVWFNNSKGVLNFIVCERSLFMLWTACVTA